MLSKAPTVHQPVVEIPIIKTLSGHNTGLITSHSHFAAAIFTVTVTEKCCCIIGSPPGL